MVHSQPKNNLYFIKASSGLLYSFPIRIKMNIQTKFSLCLTIALFLASNSIAVEKSPQPHDGRLDEQLHLAKPNLPQKPTALLSTNNPSKLSIQKKN